MARTVLVATALTLLTAALPRPLVAQTTPQTAPTHTSSRASAAKPVLSTPLNINTANATELQALPGIGAKTAARIVEYRQKNGPFKKIEELMNVRGVGEKSFLKLKPQITIAPAKAEHTGQPQQQ
jgi:competence protein ComEA